MSLVSAVLKDLAEFVLTDAPKILVGDLANLPVAQQIIAVIQEFERQHPTLGAPPPIDEEAAINAEIDAKAAPKVSER